MSAKVKNPRKKFLWSLQFAQHPINPYLCQKCTLPEISIDEVEHGDINRDVKTAGRVKVGTLIVEKLLITSGSDTWIWDWLNSCQDHILGGGLVPSDYWSTMVVNELAEDGKTILNTHSLTEVWPKKIDGLDFDRTASENTIEKIEFSVGTIDKY